MFVELAGTATSSRKRSTATMTISCARGNHAISDRRRFASRQPSPPPRKVASRMKLEKYARSRMYAGIQRMSAISRKRTRKEETNRVIADCGFLIVDLLRNCGLAINHQSAICNQQSGGSRL